MIRGAFDRGVRLFDLANLYGTHPFLTPALTGISRDKYPVVSKIWFGTGGIPEQERPDADVVVPEPWAAHVCIGGKDRRTLLITASKGLYSIRLRSKAAYTAK